MQCKAVNKVRWNTSNCHLVHIHYHHHNNKAKIVITLVNHTILILLLLLPLLYLCMIIQITCTPDTHHCRWATTSHPLTPQSVRQIAPMSLHRPMNFKITMTRTKYYSLHLFLRRVYRNTHAKANIIFLDVLRLDKVYVTMCVVLVPLPHSCCLS